MSDLKGTVKYSMVHNYCYLPVELSDKNRTIFLELLKLKVPGDSSSM